MNQILQLQEADDEHSKGGITVTLDMLTVALLISSVLYCFCFIFASRRLFVLHRMRPEMSTKKLLVCSVGLICLVRIMTILGVAAMNVANVRAHYSLQPSHYRDKSRSVNKNQDFYDDAMTVLFDLPNSIVVSTYVLLTLVWAECFLDSRFHTESTYQWKKTWLIGYMIFNSALYATQLILYTCIFFAPSDTIVRTILYAAITGTNFTAVFLVLTLYIFLNVRLSVSEEDLGFKLKRHLRFLNFPLHYSSARLLPTKGFPFRSEQSRRSFARISSVMTLWSMTRLIWGVATLLVFRYNIELLQDSHTPFWSFVVLLLLIFVCEIIPIIAMLDYSYMNMIGFERLWGEEAVQPIDLLLAREQSAAPQGAEYRVRWQDEHEPNTPLLNDAE